MVNFRLEPYFREATLQLMLDILILTLVSILLSLVFPVTLYLGIDACYIIVHLSFYYRVVIQAVIDRRKEDYITEIVTINKITSEISLAGNRKGHSYIRHFYSKEKDVDKTKVVAINNDGNKVKLRTVISWDRRYKLIFLKNQQIDQLRVTYLKRSKILIYIDIPENIVIAQGSKKKNEKMIENAIRFLNKEV